LRYSLGVRRKVERRRGRDADSTTDLSRRFDDGIEAAPMKLQLEPIESFREQPAMNSLAACPASEDQDRGLTTFREHFYCNLGP
jgi:hypothetical protein